MLSPTGVQEELSARHGIQEGRTPLVASCLGPSLLFPVFADPTLPEHGHSFHPFLSFTWIGKVTPHVFGWQSLYWE